MVVITRRFVAHEASTHFFRIQISIMIFSAGLGMTFLNDVLGLKSDNGSVLMNSVSVGPQDTNVSSSSSGYSF